MYNPAAHEQATNHNRRFLLTAREFAVGATAGVLALGAAFGAGQANAAGESAAQPRSIASALEEPITQISANIGQIGPEEKVKILSVKETVNTVSGPVLEEEVQKLTVSRKGTKLNLNLAQTDSMVEVRLGSVFTEKFFKGWDGVKGDTVPVYSQVFPYLVSPDFVTENKVKVQAVAKAKKGKWKVLSNSVTMPQFDNFSVIPIENAPVPDPGNTEASLRTSTIAGYTGNAKEGYKKGHNNKGQIKLKRPLTAEDRKNLHIRVTQSFNARPDVKQYGRQTEGKKVSVYGPFKKAKQAKTKPVTSTYKTK